MSDRLGRAIRPALTFLVPMVGVVAFDWRLRWILVFYWFEIGVTVLRQCTEAAFAGRPNSDAGRVLFPPLRRLQQKRGAVTVSELLPPVYPRTFPTILLSTVVMFAIWVFLGGQIVALGGSVNFASSPAEILLGVPVDSPASRISLLMGASGVVVGQATTFGSNVRTRPYQELSARAIVGPRQIFGPILFLLVLSTGLFLGGGKLTDVRSLTFVAVIFGRACVDVADEFGLTEQILPESFARDTQVGERDRVPPGDGEPRAQWRPDRRSVLALKVLTSPGRVFGNRAGVVVLAITAFLWFVLDGTATVLVPAGVLVTVAVLGAVPVVIETDFLYGHLEYRLYDDCVVAYDRLLKTPQWRVELDAVTETEASAAVLDRLPGLTLERLFVRTRDNSRRLVGLADAEAVRARIDEARFE